MRVSGTIKIYSRSYVNKSNQIHYYPIYDKSVSQLAHLVVIGWLRPEICTKEKGLHSVNKLTLYHASTTGTHDKC
jgi:hypothetical protein